MTDTVRCIACRHFSYKDANPGMATDGGFGKCDFAPSSTSVSAVYARICLKFEEADPQIVAKRLEWRDAQKVKFIKGILGS